MAEEAYALLTVEDMLAQNVDAVSASCWRCNHIWRAPIMMLPPETTLAKIRTLMQCQNCGDGRIHVEPVWPKGRPVRH